MTVTYIFVSRFVFSALFGCILDLKAYFWDFGQNATSLRGIRYLPWKMFYKRPGHVEFLEKVYT